MGMDVYGKSGNYFRSSVWTWRPLWQYTCEIAKETISEDIVERGQYNDGAGLDAETSAKVADALDRSIESGLCDKVVTDFDRSNENAPDIPCELCDATGWRKTPPETGKEDPEKGGMKCNGCDGKGQRRPPTTYYHFSTSDVTEFSKFLRESGGFEIW